MSTIEQLQVEVNSSSTSATSGIDSLSQSLSKLKSATKGGVGLTSIANSVKSLDTALKSVDTGSASKITALVNSLEKLKNLGSLKISSSIGSQLRSIGDATNALSNVNFYGVGRLTSVLTPLNNFNASGLKSTVNALKKLPEVSASLSNMEWGTFISQMQQLSNALTPLVSQLNTVSAAFSKLPSNITKTVNATSKITQENTKATNSYVNLWAKMNLAYNAVKHGASTIASWINESNQYIEDVNLFTASMGEYAAEAQEYAEKVSEIVGIDPGEFMRNQGVFDTIISGFGVASDKAYLMSKNLTQLGYDISSFFNISVEDAMQKLESGISGELEPLRRLGYDLSVARLQQEAYNLGIDKSVSSMTQAEKSQLRYYAIMTQVTTAQGDMARTLNAPANQLRVLKAQVTQCARALGNVFVPVLNAVLPYAIAVAKAIRKIAEAIAELFGFELPEVDYSGITSNLTSGADAIGDLADNADSAASGLNDSVAAAKKLKKTILSFDELNLMTDNSTTASTGTGSGSGTGGSGVGVSGSDLGIDLPTYDFLGDAIATRTDQIIKTIKSVLSEITAIASGALLAIGLILTLTGANIPLGIGLMAVGAVGLAATVIANWGSMTTQLATVLTAVTSILGGFLLAIGAFLAFSGVNVPLGAGLMIAGAASLGTAVAINWKFLNGDLSNALSILTGIVSGALLAMGALFTFTGVSVGLGIAFMLAGAAGIATAVGLNWNSMSGKMRNTISLIESIVGGALLALGAILAFSGVNLPLGIAMIAAGAVALGSTIALNWKSLTKNISKAIESIVAIISGALLGIGAVLALSGVATGLGIAMIAAGAVGLAATVALNWQGMPNKIKSVLSKILVLAGVSSVAIGLILTLTMVNAPLGVGLILAGAASLGTAVALNWNALTNKLKGVMGGIVSIAGASSLAIGLILVLTGVGIPLGLGLMLAGAVALGTSVAVNWGGIKKQISDELDAIAKKFGDFKVAVGNALAGFEEFGKNVIEGFKKGITDFFEDPVEWINKNIVTPFVSGFKSLFGIASPSTVMQEIGEFCTEGLQNGMTNKMKDVIAWLKGVPDSVKGALGNAKKWLLQKGKDAVQGIKNGWEEVEDSELMSKARSLKDTLFQNIGNVLNKVTSKGTDIITGIKQGYESSKQSGLISKVSTLRGEIFDGISDVLGKVKSKGSDIISGITSGYDEKKKSLLDKVAELKNTVHDNIGDVKSKVVSKGKEIITGMKSGLDNNWGSLTSVLAKLPKRIKNNVPSLYDVGQYVIGTFKRGFQSISIPLPHIGWDWNGGKIKVGNISFSLPRFKVSWYAKGGILDGAQLFGRAGNTMLGGGEAGKEAVLPLERNTEWMDTLADRVRLNLMNQDYGQDSIVDGVREGVQEATSRQNDLLREQNDLLRQLLNKDTTVEITTDSFTQAMNRKNRRDGKTVVPIGT